MYLNFSLKELNFFLGWSFFFFGGLTRCLSHLNWNLNTIYSVVRNVLSKVSFFFWGIHRTKEKKSNSNRLQIFSWGTSALYSHVESSVLEEGLRNSGQAESQTQSKVWVWVWGWYVVFWHLTVRLYRNIISCNCCFQSSTWNHFWLTD